VNIETIVLCAGKGTRMKSQEIPKVMHNISGFPMIGHILNVVNQFSDKIAVVVGHQADIVKDFVENNFQNVVFPVQKEQNGTGGAVKSALDFVPHIQKTLTEFSVTAMNPSLSGLRKLWNFATLAIRVPWLSKRLIRDLEDAMYADANEKQWDEAQINLVDKMFFENKKLVESYLKSIRDIAQFETYEKLFSLWHIFHIPLVYMLIFSGIWHVIAVHMY